MEKTSTIKVEINRFDGKSNFFLWQAKGEGCAHAIQIDRCSFIREEAEHYRGENLGATLTCSLTMY